MTTYPDVLISEVGPRDGLQSVKAVMPTAAKLLWIDALYAAGVREIEVASFVPARLLFPRREVIPPPSTGRGPSRKTTSRLKP